MTYDITNMNMKKNIIWIAALLGAMAWTGCQKAEEEFIVEKPEVTNQETVTYTVSIIAQRNDGTTTKGLDIEGEEATTTLLKSIWKAGEEVKVYLGTSCIGTLTATPDGTDPHRATLSGTVTTTGITQGTTTLTLLTPRESWNYTGQVGKLLLTDDAVNSIEKKYHYTAATNVLVTAVNGSSITTEEARFANQQSIYRLSFRYNDGNTKTAITTKSVTISAANGHLVQSQAVDGSSLVKGPISVSLSAATADPFFVALRNGDETNAEALTFTVVDNTGVTYRGTKEIPAQYKPNGTFLSVKNCSLDQRMDLALSSTEVNTVL